MTFSRIKIPWSSLLVLDNTMTSLECVLSADHMWYCQLVTGEVPLQTPSLQWLTNQGYSLSGSRPDIYRLTGWTMYSPVRAIQKGIAHARNLKEVPLLGEASFVRMALIGWHWPIGAMLTRALSRVFVLRVDSVGRELWVQGMDECSGGSERSNQLNQQTQMKVVDGTTA